MLGALPDQAIVSSFIYIDVVVVRAYSKHTAVW
jgi:hypothetical protein